MANGIRTTLAAVLVLLGAAPTTLALPNITTPPAGTVYHAVYPGGVTGEEDDLTPADVDAYEAEAGKPVAWVYFSQNWYRAGCSRPRPRRGSRRAARCRTSA